MKIFQIVWKELKASRKGLLIYTGVMVIFFMWFVSFFDPTFFQQMADLLENYPEVIRQMVGEFYSLATFGGFLNIYLLSMSWFFFGIYFILKASQDIPKEIENKTIDLMLSKPISRWELSLGKFLFHIVGACIVLGGVFLATTISIFIFPNVSPSEVNFAEIWTSFLIVLLFNFAIISTAFFFSTFRIPKMALVLSMGTIIFLYVIGQFWQSFDESIQNIKFMSIFYYSDMSNLLVNSNWEMVPVKILFLSFYSIGLTVASVIIFNKRDIPV